MKRTHVLAVLAILTAAGPALAAPQSDIEAAQTALSSGDYDGAIRSLSAAIADPDLPPALAARLYYQRGAALQRTGRLRRAIGDYTRALFIGGLPRDIAPVVHFNRAFAYERMGEAGLAIRGYGDALAAQPTFAEALYRRGELRRASGDLEAAESDLSAALAQGHGQAHFVHYALGLIAEQRGQLADAGRSYAAALALNPQFTPAQQRLVVPQTEGHLFAGLAPAAAPPEGEAAAGPAADGATAGALDDGSLGASGLPDADTVAPSPDAAPTPRPKPEETPPAQLAARPGADMAVQLGAFRSRSAALSGWRGLSGSHAEILGAHSHTILEGVDGEGAPLFRLRVGPLSREEAQRICEALKAGGAPCLVVSH